MRYQIRLIHSDEGWAASCLALPGCHSQGTTRDDAIKNIRTAITEWLEVEASENGIRAIEELEVTI